MNLVKSFSVSEECHTLLGHFPCFAITLKNILSLHIPLLHLLLSYDQNLHHILMGILGDRPAA